MVALGNGPAARHGGKGQSLKNRVGEWALLMDQAQSQGVRLQGPRSKGGYKGSNPRPGFAAWGGKRARPEEAPTKGESKGQSSSSSWQAQGWTQPTWQAPSQGWQTESWNARDDYAPSYASGKDK